MKKLYVLFLLFIGIAAFGQNETVEEYIRKESIGGELDFTKIADEQAPKAGLIAFENVVYNKKDFAILLWAAKVKSLGIKSHKKAANLWEEINKRKLTTPEMKALKAGIKM